MRSRSGWVKCCCLRRKNKREVRRTDPFERLQITPRLLYKLQPAEFLRRVKASGQRRTPREPRFVGLITTEEVQPPACPHLGMLLRQGWEGNAYFAGPAPDFPIHLHGRLKVTAPGEVPSGQIQHQVQFLVGGCNLKF